MKPRLARPLIAALVGGALLAGGAIATTPAYADPAPGESSSADPSASVPAPGESPSAPVPDPSVSLPADPSLPVPDPSDASPDPSGPPPADPDKTAPTGKFALNLSSIWIGQSITFTQSADDYADDRDADSAITRVVDFGDGSTKVSLAPGQASYTKQYTKFGTFKVTETLTDSSGNVSAPIVKTVAVAIPGKTSVSTHSVWLGQRYTFKITNVPAGTQAIKVNWGDGFIDTFAGGNHTFTAYYYRDKNGNLVTGTRQMLVQYKNKNGYSSWINAGSVTVKKDIWTPVVKITKPSSSNRVKSWSTVKGTVTDKGSGAPYVDVFVTRVTGTKIYCYNAKKKWLRVTNPDVDSSWDKCTPVTVKVSKNKWSFKLTGMTKGHLFVDAFAADWQGHVGVRRLHVNVTRS